MILRKGRTKILCPYTEQDLTDVNVLIDAINTAFTVHSTNRSDIDYLIKYYQGEQSILNKVKDVRPEISNKIVINHAQMITRNITGYFLGTPIQYVPVGAEKKDEIEELNRVVAYEDKASVDKELCEMQSICGTAYRIIYSDGEFADEVPFEDRMLDPRQTFVVYENNISEKPLFGVYYYKKLTDDNTDDGMILYCYTRQGLYYFDVDSFGNIPLGSVPIFAPYNIGGVPIIEYPNNIWRLGDWELCIDLMDAINALHSGRLDDIDQIVQSLLVFINADIDSDTYDEMRKQGVVSLKNTTNSPTEIQSISTSLDQSGMNLMSTELEELLYALIGIPDRNNRAGGGGDTGQAVELRDGWADLEIVARAKELTFKRAEKQTLKVMLNIFNLKNDKKLSLLDIDIKFSRNKNNNLLVKTQAFMNLISTKILDPSDCLTIVDLVSDVNDFVERGKVFWGDEFAGKVAEKEVAVEETFDNKDDVKDEKDDKINEKDEKVDEK